MRNLRAILLLTVAGIAGCDDASDNKAQSPAPTPATASGPADFSIAAARINQITKPATLIAAVNTATLSPDSPGMSITVTNPGAVPVDIRDVYVAGAANSFRVEGCRGTVAGDSSCTLRVSYSPGENSAAGEILILHSGEQSPLKIVVSGTAQARRNIAAAPVEDDTPATSLQAQIAASQVPQADNYYIEAPAEPAPLQYPIPPQHPTAFTKPAGPERDLSRVLTRQHVIVAALQHEVITETPVSTRWHISYPIFPMQRFAGKRAVVPLIEAGSEIEGMCGPASTTNLRAACYIARIYTTKGEIINLGQVVARDKMGRPGIDGHYDRRLEERYGPGVLASAVAAGSLLLSSDSTTTTAGIGGAVGQTQSASRRAADQFSGDLSAIARQLLNEDRTITATLRLPQSSVFTFQLDRDIYIPVPGEIYHDPESDAPLPPPESGQMNYRSLGQQPLNFQNQGQAGFVQPFGGAYGAQTGSVLTPLQAQALAAQMQAGQGVR